MKRFRFRLETALRLRQIAEQQAQSALATAERQVAAIERELNDLVDDRRRHQQYRANLPTNPVDLALQTAALRYAEAIEDALVAQRERLGEAVAIREESRRALHRRRAEREALAKLRERHRQEHLAREALQEQATLDEAAVLRWGRT